MQPRSSVRQRRKALAKDEKYAVLKGATPAKPEKAQSPDAEVLSDDDANEMFAAWVSDAMFLLSETPRTLSP